MVKADKKNEMSWKKSSRTSRVLSFSRPRLNDSQEETDFGGNSTMKPHVDEATDQTNIMNESEELQEQSQSEARAGDQNFTVRVVEYCRGKELFFVGIVLLCIQLTLVKKSLHEANTEQMTEIINKLITENERFKIEVLAKMKDMDKASNLHEDDDNNIGTVVNGLRGLVNIPFVYPIYGGLEPGSIIYISGQPSANPIRFTINFQSRISSDPPPDIAFHFDVRFSSRTVVRNSRDNNAWGNEEYVSSHFPFQPAVHFDMIIRVEQDKFMVAVNGRHFVEFKHRLLPLFRFDTLCVKDDILVSSISSE